MATPGLCSDLDVPLARPPASSTNSAKHKGSQTQEVAGHRWPASRFHLPRSGKIPAARIFHLACRAPAPRIFHFNRQAIAQALGSEIFHLNCHAIQQAFATRIFCLNRRDLAPGVIHLNHLIGQTLARDRFFIELRSCWRGPWDVVCSILDTSPRL